MPTLSGFYATLTGRTLAAIDKGELKLLAQNEPVSPAAKLRADAEFWLCEDDGKIGKFGNPSKVILHLDGQEYHVWVEPRGFSEGAYEYGLVPTAPGGPYSNRFLAVNEKLDRLEIVDSWCESAKFRCIE
ncbi:hypothetical protein P170DRAFT_469526 [Aspergillus steynii IBT 23096]|uniref:Uncharacterized protein n=1 Tax=Aspergillus steynii IBT 23096 TaxID=1392250 RepID=A0A2I2GMF0_9EURO|nr:uncharacterized protein P170DRAFT_469526 [Aspergillus steynii IBT 23096]PLB54056.1 hypothetical protein P170DRAFT_469526 [Aspergillus steynii IBT 23096]